MEQRPALLSNVLYAIDGGNGSCGGDGLLTGDLDSRSIRVIGEELPDFNLIRNRSVSE